jgi:TolA-binding protein
MSERSDLPDDMRELLDVMREHDVSPEARKRLSARLAPLWLPPGGGGGTGGDGAPPDAGAVGPSAGGVAVGGAGAGAAGWSAKALVSAVSLLIGAGGGAAAHAWFASPAAAPPGPAVVVAAASVSAAKPTESAAPAPPASEAAGAPSSEPAAPASSPAAPASGARAQERARGAGSLTAERLLVETATSALVRGDHAAAIAALQKHARRFPKGELAQEREVLLVRALRASGDDAAAQKRAKDFRKKFPDSLQEPTADEAPRRP